MGLNFTPTNSYGIESSESSSESYSTLFPSESLPRAKEADRYSSLHRRDRHGTVPLHFSSESPSSMSKGSVDSTVESQNSGVNATAQSSSARSERGEPEYESTNYFSSSWLAAVGGAFMGGTSDDSTQSYKFDTCTAAAPNGTKLACSKKTSVFSVGCVIGGAVAVAVMAATLYNVYQVQQEAEERRKMRREKKKSREKGPRQRATVTDQRQCATSTFDIVNDWSEEASRTDFDRCEEGDPSANDFLHCDDDDDVEVDPASTTRLGWQNIRQ